MDKMIVVTFDSEEKAYEATTQLKALHDEGNLTLYAAAVVPSGPSSAACFTVTLPSAPLATGGRPG